jgi:D-alanyl-D-alanine carboxypeptidase (penicillin-binding protein 5/6)
MLAWTARHKCSPNQVINITEPFSQGTVLGLKAGQHFTTINLLYAMLIPSNNDAAVALAEGCLGSQDLAVSSMNSQAAAWKLFNTHFADVHGLDNPGNYSTAHDLALMASYIMSDPTLSQIVSTSSYQIKSLDGQTYNLKSTNQLLGKFGVSGIKTGTTDFAGENFICRASIRGHEIIAVVLGSSDRFADTKKLLLEIARIYRWQVEPGLNLLPIRSSSNTIE